MTSRSSADCFNSIDEGEGEEEEEEEDGDCDGEDKIAALADSRILLY
jgi:hypothetical protein